MKTKKIFSMLCASVILVSSLFGAISTVIKDVYAEETVVDGADETKELTAPENLRYEDGFIVWDEVENAYGYTLNLYTDDNTYEYRYYVNRVELDRLCYEQNKDFGEYRFEVCAFDESGTKGEWSSQITASYEPTLSAPQNVRLSESGEETIIWDEVEGAVRYNIRIFHNDENRTLYTNTWNSFAPFTYKYYLSESGDYWISIQAMDRDYNVSEWTEPILVSHTADTVEKETLEAPKNLRFDESGENILWDEVEGADYYCLYIRSYADNGDWLSDSYYTEQPVYNNWKSITWPFSNGEYEISVYADGNGFWSSNYSEALEANFHSERDESIGVPERIQSENGRLTWDDVEGAKKYWLCISVNGELIEDGRYKVNADSNYGVWIGNELPEGTYEAELFVVDENNNYNSKTYSITLDTVHDETVWVPEMFYKFETLLWDYDRLRHDDTHCFWIRVKKGETVIRLAKSWSEYFYGLPELTNGNYTIEACVYEYTDKLGEWSKPLKITKHDGGLFDKENESTSEVVTPPEAEGVPEEDRITSITINPAFNMKHKDGDEVELDLTKIQIKANEIYDEEGLKRAEEALGEAIKGNKHYNLLDLTLLYDGEDFSNGYEGLVQVIIPIPTGHRDKTFTCYRLTEVNGEMTKEIIPGTQTEDSYIIYLEHFSEYALVGEGEHIHDYGEAWKKNETSHWKECECGEKSEEAGHAYGDWKVTKEATEAEEGAKERSCQVCGYKAEEVIPRLIHSHSYGETWKKNETSHWKECACGEKSEEAEHAYGDWKVTKEATEAEEGAKERSCEVCGYKTEEVIPKLAHSHSYGETWKKNETSHWKECACGEKSEEAKHTYGDWKITKEATEAEESVKERSCEVCGYKQMENLPKRTQTTPPVPSIEENKLVVFINKDTKIEIIAPVGAFDNMNDIAFAANPVAGQTKGDQFAFDLMFTDKKGNKVQPKAAVTVKIPVPEVLRDKTVFVYHVEDDGTYAEIDCKIENGMAVFTASKFSTYIITSEKINASSVSPEPRIVNTSKEIMANPKTGDGFTTSIVILPLLSILLACVTTVIYKKRKQLHI